MEETKEEKSTYLNIPRRPQITPHHRTFLKKYITPPYKRLPPLRPKAPLRMPRYLLVQPLIRMTHPRIDEFAPMFAREVVVTRYFRALDEG